jgi:glycosyltransferase involved in cell wall biosynthesis
MITVIVPTYNRRETLGRAVTSLLAQTYSDIEVIIVDDASTDGTEEFVRQEFSDTRIRYERLKENAGADAARNYGLDIARGKFVAFLDSDDELFPEAFDRLMRPLQDPSFGIAAAPYRLPDGRLSSFDRPEGEISFEDLLCERGMRSPKGWISVVRTSALGDIRWPLKFLQFIFFRRIASKTRVYYIPEPLGLYYLDPKDKGSVTNTRKAPNLALSVQRAKVLDTFLSDFGGTLKKSCPQMYGFYAYGAAVGLLLGGETKKARALSYAAWKNQSRPRYFLLFCLSCVPGASVLSRALFRRKNMANI